MFGAAASSAPALHALGFAAAQAVAAFARRTQSNHDRWGCSFRWLDAGARRAENTACLAHRHLQHLAAFCPVPHPPAFRGCQRCRKHVAGTHIGRKVHFPFTTPSPWRASAAAYRPPPGRTSEAPRPDVAARSLAVLVSAISSRMAVPTSRAVGGVAARVRPVGL